jgi:hypothetical protein
MHSYGVDLVGCDDYGDSVMIKIMEQMHDVISGLDIYSRRWFVQQEQLRTADESSG